MLFRGELLTDCDDDRARHEAVALAEYWSEIDTEDEADPWHGEPGEPDEVNTPTGNGSRVAVHHRPTRHRRSNRKQQQVPIRRDKVSLNETKKFSLGRIVATPGALDALQDAGQEAGEFLARHVTGDWGDLDAEDRQANDAALIDGSRLLSAYVTRKGERIWIITEATNEVGLRYSHNATLAIGLLTAILRLHPSQSDTNETGVRSSLAVPGRLGRRSLMSRHWLRMRLLAPRSADPSPNQGCRQLGGGQASDS